MVIQSVGQRVDSYYARATEGTVDRLVIIGLDGLDGNAIAARLGGHLLDLHIAGDGLVMHLLKIDESGALYDFDEAVDLRQRGILCF